MCVFVLGEKSSKMDFRKLMEREKGLEKHFEISEFLVSRPTKGGRVFARQGLQRPRKKESPSPPHLDDALTRLNLALRSQT